MPVHLPERAFFAVLGGFALALLVWILVLVRRFRRPA